MEICSFNSLKFLNVVEFVELVHLVSVEVQFTVMSFDTSITATIGNKQGPVALIKCTKHGMVNAPGSHETATDNSCDTLSPQNVVKLCVIET